MGKRSAFWIGSVAVVAMAGGVAAYAAFNPALLGSAGIHATGPTAIAEPVRRTSRIDGDMRATFDRLEKSGDRLEKSGVRVEQVAPVDQAARPATAAPLPPASPAASAAAPSEPVAASAPSAGPVVLAPAVLAKPAKGMPVSLVPGQQRGPSAEAPRVMDPRMTKALDLLANSAPRATVAALPEASAAPDQPPDQTGVFQPPVGVVAVGVADKNESEMTADDLNAREHRRIRQVLEGSAGGTN